MSWEIVKVREDDDTFLRLVNTKSQLFPKDDEIADRNPEYDAGEISELLDRDAENTNAHDFVGCHEKLSELLEEVVGDSAALRVMDELRKRRGLHGLNDVCGCRSDCE